jgi:pyridoxal phosphate enzyme (YggS family)
VPSLSERVQEVSRRIASAEERSGRAPGSVRLIAVSKGFPASAVEAAMAAGLAEFGENRVQEAESKIPLVASGARWHLVGHLQSNKAKRAASLFEEIHSIDSARIAAEVGRRAREAGRVVPCFAEVNTSGDSTKKGVPPGEALALLRRVAETPGLSVAGFMTIGPLAGGAEGARASFRELRRLRDEAVRFKIVPEGAGLSMGMSGDFEVAVEEGATVVRIGSAIFGPAP